VRRRRPDAEQVVAAVCYRRADAGVEFLLVRTKGGRRWTFPKGHVKRDELPWQAAAREAKEEAGVEGEVATSPFARYLYPNTRVDPSTGSPSSVAAFLLAVVSQADADETFREPQWFAPKDAVPKLAEGREPTYAAEHARVVRAALEALGAGAVRVEVPR
jgi:8-oxo-dGTP pyrophosphatase MutT (NUDIX family)